MDIKKINFEIKFEVTEEQKKKIGGVLFRNARLFFLIFLGMVTIYSFNIVFKKAYVDINYIQYPVYTNVLGESSGTAKLDEVLGKIEERKDNAAAIEAKRYADPFSYRDEGNAAGAERGESQAEDPTDGEVTAEGETGTAEAGLAAEDAG